MVFHQHVAFDLVLDWFPWTLTYSYAGFSCCGTSCHCVAWSFCRTSCLVCSNLCHCSGCNCIHDWCWGGCLSWHEIVCFDPWALWVSWLHHLQTARTLSPCIFMNWSCWISVPYHVLPGLVEEAEGSWPQAENISEQGQILQYGLVFPFCRSRCLWPCEWSALVFCKYCLNLLDIGGPFFIESQTTSLVLGTFRPAIFSGQRYFSMISSNSLSFGWWQSPLLKIDANFSSTFSPTFSPLSTNCAMSPMACSYLSTLPDLWRFLMWQQTAQWWQMGLNHHPILCHHGHWFHGCTAPGYGNVRRARRVEQVARRPDEEGQLSRGAGKWDAYPCGM